MPYKHQTESYRNGGEWVCWCDGFDMEMSNAIVANIRSQGFKAKRQKDRIFVRADELKKIDAEACHPENLALAD